VANGEDFPITRWDAKIAVNVSSAFHSARLALPGMKARNWGRIVNIASTHGLVASVGKSAYVAAEHGIIGPYGAIALKTTTAGVTANATCPGWVLTPLVQQQVDARAARENIPVDQAARDLLGVKQPAPQFTTPARVGELEVFLCTDAAVNVRGAAWAVDGGGRRRDRAGQ
jgi:3-hydroxybutyrate dehydrogenase